MSSSSSKRIAFLSPYLTLSGPSVTLYNYADGNETILHNQSIIITQPYESILQQQQPIPDIDRQVYDVFVDRFPVLFYRHTNDIDTLVEQNNIDILYILKKGLMDDGLITTKCKCCVHCLESSYTPHGDVYAVIGPAVNHLHRTTRPIVPPMIRVLDDITDNLRTQLGIPSNHVVFGRYGPYDGFDIPFVCDYIDQFNQPNVVFLFMNTRPFTSNPRVVYLNGSFDPRVKTMFVNTCDALLHARLHGEYFGLTVGEFSFHKKHIITYASSPATTHLQLLGRRAMLYRNAIELDYIIDNFTALRSKYPTEPGLYQKALVPEKVMRIFHRTFIMTEEERDKENEQRQERRTHRI